MGDAKRLVVQPIPASDANRIIRTLHYSGKVVPNSQVHLGVFLDGKCGGAMQFGPSTDKRRLSSIVRGTKWHEFIELNRLAFADWLPRNGESRCIAYAMRWLHERYPWLKWVASFADGTQCGDGTIYRAAGFVLTNIKRNNQILELPNGTRINKKTLDNPNHTAPDGRFGSAMARAQGAVPVPGYQLRYIYFLHPEERGNLTVPILPFSEIERRGAGMYRGTKRSECDGSTAVDQTAGGGSTPTRTLHGQEGKI